jgi:hypothetical protein
MSLMLNKMLLFLLSILILCLIAGLIFYIFFYKPNYQPITTNLNCNNQVFIQISDGSNGTFLYPADFDIKLLSFTSQYFPSLINTDSILISKDGLDLNSNDQKVILDRTALLKSVNRKITETDKINLKYCFPQAKFY